MDGRKPTGILYVNTHVADPTIEIEYDRWYHDVHFPDVTEPGIFVEAMMFHNASVPPAENEGKFLAFLRDVLEGRGGRDDGIQGARRRTDR